MKKVIQQICPPVIWDKLSPRLSRLKRAIRSWRSSSKKKASADGTVQDVELYWDEDFAQALETWGEGNAWKEIELLMADRKGKVLDIACGTGKVMQILSSFPEIEIYGCDISDLLIGKAIKRGIPPERLKVCDATQTGYQDDFFDYAYSIGSLEHFTEEGIYKFLQECRRIVKNTSFHQIPVSRGGQNEGWIQPLQSYHNNSVDWWLEKFRTAYKDVYVIGSLWEDKISVGKWFVCKNKIGQAQLIR